MLSVLPGTGRLNRLSFLSLVPGLLGAMTFPALSQNDACSGAIILSPGTSYVQDTTQATNDDVKPSCQPFMGSGVWFKFTPPNSSSFTVSTCGSDFDTVLGLYTGSCGALTEVACNDDDGPDCSGFAASIRFSGVVDTTYFILAGGFLGATGHLRIQIVNPVLSGMNWSNGVVRFTIKGPAGSNCVVQTSANLSSWTPLLTNAISAGGTLNVTDTGSTNKSRRFYRAWLR
jgi:hypothetical protein